MIRIGITMGDPAGIGPEVILRALAVTPRAEIAPLVFGDRAVFADCAQRLGLAMDFPLRPVGELGPAGRQLGHFTRAGGLIQGACLEAAAVAYQNGEFDALVTGPIHKKALVVCALPGPGHTEWLSWRFQAPRAVMLMTSPSLKVVMATTHVPLAKVASVLNVDDLVQTVSLAARELHRFFASPPRLAVAALNPHGEVDGEAGPEERSILAPAVEILRAQGLTVSGPIPGDAVFVQALAGKFDAVVALYHDQGLAPVKTLHFAETVNVTLGLGLIRTSPDHGVAYDIAEAGRANPESMRRAIALAAQMVRTGVRD